MSEDAKKDDKNIEKRRERCVLLDTVGVLSVVALISVCSCLRWRYCVIVIAIAVAGIILLGIVYLVGEFWLEGLQIQLNHQKEMHDKKSEEARGTTDS